MAESELRRLAEGGIGAYPPARLRELADDCRAQARARASARLFVIAEAIDLLAAAWEPHEALWSDATERLDDVVRADLPNVLDEENEEAATSLANAMRDALTVVLGQTPPL